MPEPQKTIAEGGTISTYEAVKAARGDGAPTEKTIAGALQAYQSGTMAPEDAKVFEAAVRDGRIMLPRGASLQAGAQPEAPQAATLSPKVWEAYKAGRMSAEDAAALEDHARKGEVQVPAGVQIKAAAPETTAVGLAGAATRGVLPYMAGAATGAAIGAPLGGVGAIPGAIAGAGSVALSQMVLDPIVSAANAAFGTNVATPTQAFEELMTRAGIAEPKSAAEKMVHALSSGLASSAAGVGAGRMLQQAAAPAAQAAGAMLAEQPAQQIAAGGGAGLASQAAAELGLSPGLQMLAGFAGGGLAASRVPRAMTAAEAAAHAAPIPAERPVAAAAPATAPARPVVPEAAVIPERVAPPEAPPAAAPAPTPAAAPKTAPAAAGAPQSRYVEPSELAAKMEAATQTGPKGDEARTWLKTLADQDTAAMEAAHRQGVELPPDVYARNVQIREAAGLERAQKMSVASKIWRDTLQETGSKFDALLEKAGARMTPEGPATAQVASEVKSSIEGQINALSKRADDLYAEIRNRVPADARGTADNVLALIEERKGAREATPGEGPSVSTLTPLERKIARRLTPAEGAPPPTYTTIDDLRKEVGRALQGQGHFKDEDTALAKQLYKALSEDQERIASQFGTSDLWKDAKKVVVDRKLLEDAATSTFGKELQNSIAPTLVKAMKGDVNALPKIAQVLKAVPEQLRTEAFLTGFADATRSKAGAAKGEFGFQQYVDAYRALRRAPEAWAMVAKALGPEGAAAFQDLFKVSKIIVQANAEISRTGQSLQKVINDRFAAGALEQFLTKGPGQYAGMIAKPARILTSVLDKSRKARAEATLNVFQTPEMVEVLKETAATGAAKPETIRAAVRTPAFSKFAKVAGLPHGMPAREAWLRAAMTASTTAEEPQQ